MVVIDPGEVGVRHAFGLPMLNISDLRKNLKP
jgi:hypothetical protein